ncbi:hypothetical protein Q6348_01810 [Isoptericola sp. b441]|uniref:DUF3137 domain-containing protein n=1 Tax=Actinotalea lenta TaxID=3064654 RepID=A0ABT9D9S7_9CELL|nr:hypothetical protein [Isoptericola sp. b441]MDO8105928.1 hypothetical protein [Isoptericola sp. b441]
MPDRRLAAVTPVVALSTGALLVLAGALSGSTGGSALVYVLLVAVVGAGAVFGWWYGRQREKATRAWAARIGWTYYGTDPGLPARWQRAPFGEGRSRRVGELIAGAYGERPASSFAYRYTTGSGKNRRTHTYWVVTMGMPTWLPGLQLTHQGLGARIVTTFGGQDLEFESEDFNAAWRVEARDAKFAHDVLHPRTLERLVRPDAVGLNLRIEGSDLLCWSQGLPDTAALASRLGVMRALIDGIPRYVWLDHGYDPASIRTDLGETWKP